jgi:hypothetical protein
MRAYNLVMLMVLINAGMMLVVAMGMFGPLMEPTDSGWNVLIGVMTASFNVGGRSVTGIEALSAAIVVFTMIGMIPGVNVTASGAGIAAFTFLFFSSLLITIGLFTTLSESIPGLDIFISIYSLIHFFIFAYALIQMTTGGAKSNV